LLEFLFFQIQPLSVTPARFLRQSLRLNRPRRGLLRQTLRFGRPRIRRRVSPGGLRILLPLVLRLFRLDLLFPDVFLPLEVRLGLQRGLR
jgi:hypothetical protein